MKTKLVVLTLGLIMFAIITQTTPLYGEKSEESKKENNPTNSNKDKVIAESLVVTIHQDTEQKYYTFSKIGYVKSKNIEYTLESVPSKDKKSYYELVAKFLNQRSTARPFDISIDIMASDGTLIETLDYKTCNITSYFVYVNDSKGDYRFIKDNKDRMEIRDVTKFECVGLLIRT